MLGYDDIAAAAAGEERDAMWRSLAEDYEVSRRVVRPRDVAARLGRGRVRPASPPGRAASTSAPRPTFSR